MTPWRAARVLVLRRGTGTIRLDFLFAIGICLATFLTLGVVAAFQVADKQEDRSAATSPVLDYNAPPLATGSAVVDPALVPDRRWNGKQVEREYVAATPAGTRPPGVRTLPSEGEYVASPGLVNAMAKDPVVAALFKDQELAEVIGPEGLTDPGSLKAIVGVPSTASFLIAVDGYGASTPMVGPSADDRSTLNTVVTTLSLILVVLPLLSMLFVVSRLTGRARQVRSRGLRLLGMSKVGVRLVEAVSAFPLVLPAISLGVFAFELVRRSGTLPGSGFTYFPGDARLSPLLVAAITGVIVAVGGALAATAISTADDVAETARTPRAWRYAGTVGITVLSLGVVALVAMPLLRDLLGTPANFLLWPACAAVASGLAIGGPAIVSRIASRRASSSPSVSALVGLRMAADGSSTVLRISSVMCVLVVLLLGTQSFLNILNGGTMKAWTDRADGTAAVPTTVTDLGGRETMDQFVAAVGDAPTIQVRQLRTSDGAKLRVVFGTCQALSGLSGRAIQSCDGQPAWIHFGERPADPQESRGTLELDGARLDLLSLPTLRVSNLPPDVDRALFVPNADAAVAVKGEGSIFYSLLRGDDLNETLARISSTNPTAQIDLGDLDRHNPDTQQFPEQVEWIKVAAAVGLLLGALAVAGAAVGEAGDRAGRFRGLMLLGASRVQLVKVNAYASATPMVILGATACALGGLVSFAFRALDERATFPSATLMTMAGGVSAVALLIFTASLPQNLKSDEAHQ